MTEIDQNMKKRDNFLNLLTNGNTFFKLLPVKKYYKSLNIRKFEVILLGIKPNISKIQLHNLISKVQRVKCNVTNI